MYRKLVKSRRKSYPKWMYVVTLSSTFSLGVHAQKEAKFLPGYADGLSIEEVFEDVKKQTNYTVVASDEVLKTNKKIAIAVKDRKITDVLDEVSNEYGLTYQISGTTISVKEQQNHQQIKGVVKDKEGYTIPGAIVTIKGTDKGVATDSNGVFSLTANVGVDDLEISFIGYKTQIVRATSNLAIILQEDHTSLDEVVVTALGIKREEKRLGYAQETVNAEKLATAVANNWSSGLKGKVAGLNIASGGTGPINSQRIQLRGNTSLDASKNYALIVIDGVPMDQEINSNGYNSAAFGNDSPVDNGNAISDLNQDDIESVTVLKGPTAAALYGSRAANGALIITTKSGKKNDRFGITYNSSVAFDVINKWPDYQYEYGQGSGGYFDKNGNPYYSFGNSADGPDTGNHPEAWGPKFADQYFYQYDPTTQGQTPERTLWRPYKNNRKDFFDTGVTVNNAIAFQGGNDKGSMRLNISHTDNKWIVPNTGYKKYGTSFNGNYQISDRIKLSAVMNYNNRKSDNLPVLGYNNGSLAYFMMFLLPNVDINWYKPIWKNGKEDREQLNPFSPWSSNPYYITNVDQNTLDSNQFIGNVKADIKLTDKLDFMGRLAINNLTQFRETKRGFSSKRHAEGFYARQDISSREINADFLLTYKDKISEALDYQVMVGANHMSYTHRNLRTSVDALVVPGVFKLSNGVNNPIVNTSDALKKVNSTYGMMTVGYNNFLFLDVTARNDWSSTLPSGNNSYFYPSVSASAILSDMFVMPTVIDYLKYRVSFAKVGSDTDPYQISKYYAQSNFPSSAIMPSTLYNANLKPEITSSWETGVEMKMLQNRLGFDVTFYNSDTKNQILVLPMDIAEGFSSQVINAGKVRNKGVELVLHGTPIKQGDFTWNVSANWSKNKNEVLELKDNLEEQVLATVVNGRLIAKVGGTTTALYGRKFVRSPEGQVVYSNGVPVLGADPEYIGDVAPKWKAGLVNNFKYKNWNFGLTIDGSYGGKIYSHTHHKATEAGQLKHTLRGREEGELVGEGVVLNADGSYTPNTTPIRVDNYYRKYYEYQNVESNTFDASFLKIRELSLSYSFAKKQLKRIGLESLTLTVYGRDLKTFTDFPIYDPEAATMNGSVIVPGMETGQMPSTASYGFNLKVEF